MTIPNKTLAELHALREKEKNRRLAACWKALQGVPTEWIENYIASGTENLLQENAKLYTRVNNLEEQNGNLLNRMDDYLALQDENAALKADAPTPYSRRVATCLNALKGVPDEWIEQYADGKSIKNIIEQSCDLVRKEEGLIEKLLATEEENAELTAAVDNLLKVFDETEPEVTWLLLDAINTLRTLRKVKP